jgi:hypothetical protein
MNFIFSVKFDYFLAFLTTCTLFGCQMKDKVSTDANAFDNLFAIDVAFKSISWELFDTPEYKGGTPAPTDFVTLIAQVDPPNDTKFDERPVGAKVWIAPESARPWLDENFRHFLEQSKSTTIDVSEKGDCRAINGILRKTSKPINGFICKSEKKMLIYMTVLDYTLNLN